MTGKEYVSTYRISEWQICLFIVHPQKVWYQRTMVSAKNWPLHVVF